MDRIEKSTDTASPSRKTGKVLVGTAGWSYPDWKGIFYPASLPRGMHALAYLARYFDTVEVNTSFYRPLDPELAARWVKETVPFPRFSFTAKAWRRFTHEREAPPSPLEVERFRSGIAPLREAGRLAAVLFQFPWSFRNTPVNREWLKRVLDLFPEVPAVVEVRHGSWDTEEGRALLQARKAALCNVDQPLFHGSLPPREAVTAPLAYVRLHGRNEENWFKEDAGRDARYDYLYSMEEIEPWVDRIRRMQARAERVFVITNNHYKSKAAVNAFQFIHRLFGQKVPVPPSLLRSYPGLAPVSRTVVPGSQGRLPGF